MIRVFNMQVRRVDQEEAAKLLAGLSGSEERVLNVWRTLTGDSEEDFRARIWEGA